jgi:hypothetical protein
MGYLEMLKSVVALEENEHLIMSNQAYFCARKSRKMR